MDVGIIDIGDVIAVEAGIVVGVVRHKILNHDGFVCSSLERGGARLFVCVCVGGGNRAALLPRKRDCES